AKAAPAPSIMEQSTAILDTGSPQHAAIAAQIAAASAAAAAKAAPPAATGPALPPAGKPAASIMDQSTAVLDPNSPQHAAAPAQHSIMPAAPTPPAARAAAQRAQQPQGARSLAPMPVRKKASTALRWVIGPAMMAATAGVTFFLAGILLPGPVLAPPPKPVVV